MKPDDFARLLYARNARLRAWQGVGYPVDGAWSLRPTGTRGCLYPLSIRCLACGKERENLADRSAQSPECHVQTLEWLCFLWLEQDEGCTHLAPIRHADSQGDPEEVRALTALELLAGP